MRERLSERHPVAHPAGLGGSTDLSQHLHSARLGGEGDRAAQQLLALSRHRKQGKTRNQHASDRHTNVCSYKASRQSRASRANRPAMIEA